MCHDFYPSKYLAGSRSEDRPLQKSFQKLQLDVVDLDGGVVLPMAALNLVLIRFLELQNGELFGAILRDNLAGNNGLGGIGAGQKLLLISVHGKNRPEGHLFAHFTFHALDTNGVARRDAVLLSTGLDYGVHRSSRS